MTMHVVLYIPLLSIQEVATLSKCVLVTEYIFSRVSTGEGPPVGGEYPASEGLVVMH